MQHAHCYRCWDTHKPLQFPKLLYIRVLIFLESFSFSSENSYSSSSSFFHSFATLWNIILLRSFSSHGGTTPKKIIFWLSSLEMKQTTKNLPCFLHCLTISFSFFYFVHFLWNENSLTQKYRDRENKKISSLYWLLKEIELDSIPAFGAHKACHNNALVLSRERRTNTKWY